ncbi:hypothetical protein FB45DRAFT_1121445 [Roridomyces roridus]|uniref:DUF6535 domain-containing protein n=1 Tax=Roridomyces roridus TaxID=1738132 RepID=A0AAD7B5A6_9AGAR|nr:hypothetical protein FB45DRAFT_1121445 [Roridomyces roridus]
MSALEAGLTPPQNKVKASLLRRFVGRASRFLLSGPGPSDTGTQAPGDDSSLFSQAPRNHDENEESAAKMWSIYVGEAERYDAALVESWKADMGGMLVFSGLFSASLTAFLIESYKKLQPDSGDLTVAAIQQLVAISLGDAASLQPTPKFTPSVASLVCNALWFVSLSLSLICALLATLVEQWAREFLHKTEMRPSPARRARIFSFLYFGLKSFHMPTVVDAVPCLIHGSLLQRYLPGRIYPAAWAPFSDRAEFDFANFHFTEAQSSEKDINTALDIWAASVMKYGATAPWKDAREMYAAIDTIRDGQAPWRTYTLRYSGPLPPGQPPKWMTHTYELCTRNTRLLLHNQLSTTVFRQHVNLVPYRQFNHAGKRVYSNLMSGDWAWKQADEIAEDPQTHGSVFVPVVAGSDKTTVSVGTGHQEFHPVYISPGVLTGTARHAHGNGVLPAAFLPIPKTSKKHRARPAYQKFVRQMYHACMARVFQPLKAAMTIPEIVQCPDRHFRRVVYGLGPYIADYPEQVWLATVVQGWCPKCDAEPDDLDKKGARLRTQTTTEFLITQFDPGILWDDFGIRADVAPFTMHFPRTDIHELLSSDLLHQVIKGTFKDHLVSWVNDYLHVTHGEKRALEIIQDIDRRISAVCEFPGLRRFPDGRDFHQWTGDDSKALMKVYLAAVAGYLPSDMIRCLAAFMDTCYLSVSTYPSPANTPSVHYIRSIRLFGSPNGLCSSITESKHIKAVKEPWRRSSRFNALPQMLRSISRLEKLAAAAVSFRARGMLIGTTSSYTAMVLDGCQPQMVAAAVDKSTNSKQQD